MTKRHEIFRVMKAQSGDREAMDALFSSIQGPLFRCVFQILGQQEEAEDVLQDVFVIIHKNLVLLRSPELFNAWAYRIATREATRQLRKTSRLRKHEVDSEMELIPNSHEDDPLRNVQRGQLNDLIPTVPPASRSVLALHYSEDLSLPEVAEILGIPIGTVKSRLSYGLQFLRDKLDIT